MIRTRRTAALALCARLRRTAKAPVAVAARSRGNSGARGGAAIGLSRKFRPPRRADDARWRKVEALILAGSRFESTWTYAPCPGRLRDVPQFVRAHYAEPENTIGLPHEKPRYRRAGPRRRQRS